MTRPTGKRERRKRNAELFSAELRLRGVELYLMDAVARADFYRDFSDTLGYSMALAQVRVLLFKVYAEQKAGVA